MPDLEMTKLCAEAMGLKLDADCDYISWGNPVKYDPLRDDAQAMALGKRFPEEFKRAVEEWAWHQSRKESFDLNYHLCGRIAKMQASRSTREER